MEKHRSTLSAIGMLVLAWVFMNGMPVGAQMDHGKMAQKMDHGKMGAQHASHGGQMEVTDRFGFETVFTESDIRVYVTNLSGQPQSPRSMAGKVMLMQKDKKPTELALSWTNGADDPTRGNRTMPGMMANDSTSYLVAAFDSRSTEAGGLKAHIMLSNLPGKGAKTAQWEVPYQRGPLFGMACPMHPDQASLEPGKCAKCGGMDYQPATVFYECCEGCGDMRRTAPGTCEKCGMEMQLKAVDLRQQMGLTPEEPGHDAHSH